MRVLGTQPGVRSEPGSRSRRSAGSHERFVGALRDAAGADAASAPATACLGSVTGVLAVQEAPSATDKPARRRAIRRAESLLESLEALRLDIIAGVIPLQRLQALVGLLHDHEPLEDDPGLAAVIAEIELRAAVELAKHTAQR